MRDNSRRLPAPHLKAAPADTSAQLTKKAALRVATDDKNLDNTAGNLRSLESTEAELTQIRKTNIHA